MSNIDLPPLPWPDIEAWLEVSSSEEIAAGIHAYARAAVKAEREACAKLCEAKADRAKNLNGAAHADACADAIRARGKS